MTKINTGGPMTPQDAALLASLTGFTPGPWRHDSRQGGIDAPQSISPRTGKPARIALTLLLPHNLGSVDAENANAALIAAAPDLHRIATELAAENKRLRDQVNKIDRDRRLVEAQVDRLVAMANSMDDDYRSLQLAAESLGAMPEGYCFCSKDRIGDDSKIHEPECAELRAALQVQP